MFFNRIKALMRSGRPSQSPVATPQNEPAQPVSKGDWIECTKTMAASYPKLFLGVGFITGASIGWIIKRR
jgi:hypothetical protein